MTASRIGVCSWSLRPRDPHDLVDALERLEIRSVQLALNPLVEDPDTWGDAVDILRTAGVHIASGMMAMKGEDYSTLESIARTGGVRPDETWPANLALATRIAALAARHAIDLVSFHAGFMPEDGSDPEAARLLDRLHVMADAFEPRDVSLALETGQETAATLVQVLFRIDRPIFGVNFDPANMILYGRGDPVAALGKLRPRVRQVHVKDARPATAPGTWGAEVPVGEGAVDWPAFFATARTIEPPVSFLIEREAGDDREGDVIRARRVIEAALGPARDRLPSNRHDARGAG